MPLAPPADRAKVHVVDVWMAVVAFAQPFDQIGAWLGSVWWGEVYDEYDSTDARRGTY